MSSKTSLNHKILLKVSIMITIIIILITFIGYSHIVSILESNTKIQLEKYIIERGHRESSIFQLAQDNLTLLKKEFYQQLETANSTEQQFAELFVKWPDGTTRNNLINNQTIAEFDTTKYPSVFLDKQIDINADIRQRVLIFYNLLQNYGPAWSNRFVDTYFLAPENIMVIYWPGEPWSLTASADLNIHNEEYFYISDKKHNPNRQQAWTGLYFDHVVKLWMVSVETPVDDKQGRHIATIGHDIVLNELMERTINDTLEGAYNLILRKDGRLIVEPNKIEAIKQKDGYFDILKSEDQQLINIFNSIKNIESGQIVIDNKTEFLAVTKIEGPDWYFVTVYPRTLLTEQAFATAGFIIILGIILLILVISVLYIVLRKQVTKPLHKFIFASQQIAAGNFATDSLPTKRSDELGQLANSLQDMTNQLDNSFKAKEAKNIMFSNIILDIVMVSEGLATGNLQVKPQSKYQDESVKIKTALETALTGLRHVIADIVKVSEGLATGNKIMPNADYPGDFSQIKEALETASSKLAQATAQNITQDWVKTGQAQLNELMRGEQDIVILTRNIITFLCEYVNSQVGLFYLLKKDEQQPYLQIVSSYAYTENNERPNKYLLGEGLVGQVALNKRVLAFSQTTEECPIIIRSGLANSMPYHLLLLPCLYENSVKGIIEIGTSKELSNIQHNFLEQVASNIAIAINTANSRTQMQTLLKQSQQQSEELTKKQQEMLQTNEELQSQSEELQSQSEEMQSQQEELRQTNEILEERTQGLEQQKAETQEKNRTLEINRIEMEKVQVEMEKTQAAITLKAEELELASKYKSEFLANMSHELRTPLNSLLILAQLLVDNKPGTLNEKQVEYAQTINSAGKDLLTLINDILDLSKVEAGKIEVQWENISLPDLLTTIEQKFIPIADNKELKFITTIDADVNPNLLTDSQRLKQIINNLLSNAFKFTSEGSIQITVKHPAKIPINIGGQQLELDKTIAISVIDSGIGIPKDKQQAIFEAFQQADGSTSRKFGGTGLGLSISRQLARLLGGELTLTSDENGSIFTLYLPESAANITDTTVETNNDLFLQKIPESKLKLEPKTPVKLKPIQDNRDDLKPGDKSILFVEDDRKFSKILTDLANEKGFKHLLAEDGMTGVQLAEQYKPSAIILDIGLPELNGWSVMERLKDNPETRHIPVHFMSASDQSMEAKKMGAIGYLLKPVSMEKLTDAFKKIEQFLTRTVKNLLIVTDVEIHKLKIMELVEEDGIQIQQELTVDSAFKNLEITYYDCIILDIDIENGSGSLLLEMMHQDQTHCQTPIIVYADRDLTTEEESLLMRCSDEIPIKSVSSSERLLDEATLFLHQIEAKLPDGKRDMLHMIHDKEAILKNKKVLIVDDDVRNVFALATVLEDNNMETACAVNGQEGLELLEKHSDIAIVLMDIMMPEMDGYEAMREIRNQPKYRNLPIIALTAKAMKDDKVKCIEAGANDYLAKPVDTNKLLSLMRVWLYR